MEFTPTNSSSYESPSVLAPKDRNNLIATHLPLVTFLVSRMSTRLPAHVERDDLWSAGAMGLILAADRFDPRRGVLFKTFAERYIRGRMLDELRAQDWLPRHLREESTYNEREAEVFTDELNDMVGLETFRGRPVPDKRGEGNIYTKISLDDSVFVDDDTKTLHDTLEDNRSTVFVDNIVETQIFDQICKIVKLLPRKERLTIELVFLDDFTQEKVSQIMNVCPSRISQIRNKAIRQIVSHMQAGIKKEHSQ